MLDEWLLHVGGWRSDEALDEMLLHSRDIGDRSRLTSVVDGLVHGLKVPTSGITVVVTWGSVMKWEMRSLQRFSPPMSQMMESLDEKPSSASSCLRLFCALDLCPGSGAH